MALAGNGHHQRPSSGGNSGGSSNRRRRGSTRQVARPSSAQGPRSELLIALQEQPIRHAEAASGGAAQRSTVFASVTVTLESSGDGGDSDRCVVIDAVSQGKETTSFSISTPWTEFIDLHAGASLKSRGGADRADVVREVVGDCLVLVGDRRPGHRGGVLLQLQPKRQKAVIQRKKQSEEKGGQKKMGTRWSLLQGKVKIDSREKYKQALLSDPDPEVKTQLAKVARLGTLLMNDGEGSEIRTAALLMQRAVNDGFAPDAVFWRQLGLCHWRAWQSGGIFNAETCHLRLSRTCYHEALRHMENAVDPVCWKQCAMVHMALGSHEGAARTLGQLVTSFPNFDRLPSVILLSGVLLKHLHSFEQSCAYLYQCVVNGAPAPYTHADILFYTANTYDAWARDLADKADTLAHKNGLDGLEKEEEEEHDGGREEEEHNKESTQEQISRLLNHATEVANMAIAGYNVVYELHQKKGFVKKGVDMHTWLDSAATFQRFADKAIVQGHHLLASDLYAEALRRDHLAQEKPSLWYALAKCLMRCGQGEEALTAVRRAQACPASVEKKSQYAQAEEAWARDADSVHGTTEFPFEHDVRAVPIKDMVAMVESRLEGEEAVLAIQRIMRGRNIRGNTPPTPPSSDSGRRREKRPVTRERVIEPPTSQSPGTEVLELDSPARKGRQERPVAVTRDNRARPSSAGRQRRGSQCSGRPLSADRTREELQAEQEARRQQKKEGGGQPRAEGGGNAPPQPEDKDNKRPLSAGRDRESRAQQRMSSPDRPRSAGRPRSGSSSRPSSSHTSSRPASGNDTRGHAPLTAASPDGSQCEVLQLDVPDDEGQPDSPSPSLQDQLLAANYIQSPAKIDANESVAPAASGTEPAKTKQRNKPGVPRRSADKARSAAPAAEVGGKKRSRKPGVPQRGGRSQQKPQTRAVDAVVPVQPMSDLPAEVHEQATMHAAKLEQAKRRHAEEMKSKQEAPLLPDSIAASISASGETGAVTSFASERQPQGRGGFAGAKAEAEAEAEAGAEAEGDFDADALADDEGFNSFRRQVERSQRLYSGIPSTGDQAVMLTARRLRAKSRCQQKRRQRRYMERHWGHLLRVGDETMQSGLPVINWERPEGEEWSVETPPELRQCRSVAMRHEAVVCMHPIARKWLQAQSELEHRANRFPGAQNIREEPTRTFMNPHELNTDAHRVSSLANFRRIGYSNGSSAYTRFWEQKLRFALSYFLNKVELRRCISEVRGFAPDISADEAFCALAEAEGSVGEACGKLSDEAFRNEVRTLCKLVDVNQFTELRGGRESTQFTSRRFLSQTGASAVMSPGGGIKSRSQLTVDLAESMAKPPDSGANIDDAMALAEAIADSEAVAMQINDETDQGPPLDILGEPLDDQPPATSELFWEDSAGKQMPDMESVRRKQRVHNQRAAMNRLTAGVAMAESDSGGKKQKSSLEALIEDSLRRSMSMPPQVFEARDEDAPPAMAKQIPQPQAQVAVRVDDWGNKQKVSNISALDGPHRMFSPLQLKQRSFDDAVHCCR